MEKKNIKDWAQELGVQYEMLRGRWIRRGRIGEQTLKGCFLTKEEVDELMKERKTVRQICVEQGISHQTYYNRLKKAGKNIKKSEKK